MKITDLLSDKVIRIPLKNTDKRKIIEEMVDILDKAYKLKNRDAVLEAVFKREHAMSTGMGDGVAIPHAKSEHVDQLLAAFGVTKTNVDFESIDDKPVRLVFLLVGPTDQTGPHLTALSRISRLMHRAEFRDTLSHAKNGKQVIKAISAEEKKYFPM
jgi:fructose-specific phosphotransferase system IIA component